MTTTIKNKRFTVQSSYLGLYTIFDEEKMKPLNSMECIEVLNKQHETIEQLKQQIKDMEIRFKRKYDHEFDEIVDEL